MKNIYSRVTDYEHRYVFFLMGGDLELDPNNELNTGFVQIFAKIRPVTQEEVEDEQKVSHQIISESKIQ